MQTGWSQQGDRPRHCAYRCRKAQRRLPLLVTPVHPVVIPYDLNHRLFGLWTDNAVHMDSNSKDGASIARPRNCCRGADLAGYAPATANLPRVIQV